MQRQRERLRTAVVGNRHRRPAPCLTAIDEIFGVGYAVHRTHIGVQMQLDTLFGCIIHTNLLLGLDNRGRLQNALLLVAVKADLALYDQVHAGLDGRHDITRLIFGHELGDADGVGVIGDIERNLDPLLAGLFAGDLAVIDKEHVALDGHAVEFAQRVANRDRFLGVQLAQDEVFVRDLLHLGTLISAALPCRTHLEVFARLLGHGFGYRHGIHRGFECGIARRVLALDDLLDLLFGKRHGLDDNALTGLGLDALLHLAQRNREVSTRGVAHRDAQMTVGKIPATCCQQTGCRRHAMAQVLPQQVDVLRGQCVHLVARRNGKTGQSIRLRDFLAQSVQMLERDGFLVGHMADHLLVIVTDRQRAHFSAHAVLICFTFTAIKKLRKRFCHKNLILLI